MTFEIIALSLFAILATVFICMPKHINAVCLIGMLAFPLAMIGADQSFADMRPHFVAGGVALAIGFVLFTKGGFGGGTVKACTLAALWLPTAALFPTFTTMGIVLGVLSVVATAMKPHTKHIMSYTAAVLCGTVVWTFYQASPMGMPIYQAKYALKTSAADAPVTPPTLRGPLR